jgi:hypothetical protein
MKYQLFKKNRAWWSSLKSLMHATDEVLRAVSIRVETSSVRFQLYNNCQYIHHHRCLQYHYLTEHRRALNDQTQINYQYRKVSTDRFLAYLTISSQIRWLRREYDQLVSTEETGLCSLLRIIIPAFGYTDWGEPRKCSDMIPDTLVQIRTGLTRTAPLR